MFDGRPIVDLSMGNTVPRTLVRKAERYADKPLLLFPRENHEISYADLVTRAEAGSTRLRYEFGLAPGLMAAIYLGNCPDFIYAWFSCQFAGLVDVPVNHEFRKSTLHFCLAAADARIIISDGAGVENLVDPEVGGFVSTIDLLVLAGEYDRVQVEEHLSTLRTRPPIVALSDLIAPCRSESLWDSIEATAPTLIRYTSGTTGPAKGILQSHLHVLAKSAVHNRILRYTDQDILYSPFPLHHNLASVNGLIGTIQAGGTMISVPRFTASRFWEEASASNATVAHLLRSTAALVVAQPPRQSDHQHKLRYLWAGTRDEAFEERFNVPFINIYALGEVGVITYNYDAYDDANNTGQPLPEMEVRIVDALDQEVPQGTAGEITIRPRHPHRVMLGYFNNLAATMRAFKNLWFHTGDSGLFDSQGNLHFVGRMGDTIRRRGVNISSEQLDSEIRRFSGIEDCGVVAVPADFDQEIHACIMWKDQAADAEAAIGDLVAFLNSRLPREYVPRYFEPMTDLPRTNTGKVRKAELRERKVFGRTWDRVDAVWIDPEEAR